jgi:hypothetical protein
LECADSGAGVGVTGATTPSGPGGGEVVYASASLAGGDASQDGLVARIVGAATMKGGSSADMAGPCDATDGS